MKLKAKIPPTLAGIIILLIILVFIYIIDSKGIKSDHEINIDITPSTEIETSGE
jgi:hypothetical protein